MNRKTVRAAPAEASVFPLWPLAVTMPAPDRAYNLAELTALPLEDMAGELERLKTPSSLARH